MSLLMPIGVTREGYPETLGIVEAAIVADLRALKLAKTVDLLEEHGHDTLTFIAAR